MYFIILYIYYLFIFYVFIYFVFFLAYLFIYLFICACVCAYVHVHVYMCVSIYIYIYIHTCDYFFFFFFFPSLACQKDITCYLNQNLAQCKWVYSYKIYNKDSLLYVYLYNSPWLRGKWRRSFLIGQYHFKNSLAVAFKFFSFVCTECFCMLGVFLQQDRRLEQKFW